MIFNSPIRNIDVMGFPIHDYTVSIYVSGWHFFVKSQNKICTHKNTPGAKKCNFILYIITLVMNSSTAKKSKFISHSRTTTQACNTQNASLLNNANESLLEFWIFCGFCGFQQIQ